ncbi:S8 family serine peptidase [Halalkalibacter kiskunsagensis]|uniref:S8 family serine peptidase n=1 Tax=Halalkalibacter kiskunsagensis TaxID=1548599 RepID=A0ABV6K9K0_9BACI
MKVKHSLILFLSFFLLLGMDHNENQDEFIITFDEEVDVSLLEELGYEIIEQFELFPGVVVRAPETEQDQLSAQSTSDFTVEPNIQMISVASYGKNWGIDHLTIPKSWESGYSGKGVKVAVIDSGIATNHSALTVAGGISMLDYTSSYNDDFGHGTHAAGIIASSSKDAPGVAQGIELYAVKTLDKNGTGPLDKTIHGIEWAVKQGVDIINLSLGSDSPSPALKAAVDQAHERGVLIVGAAGNKKNNYDRPMDVQYPARYGSVIAVSAIDQNNNLARFSASGPAIELTAPGVQIYSTYLNNGFRNDSGTSMSTPFVTGVLALYKEAFPSASNLEIRRMAQTSALDLGSKGRDHLYGFGLVQPPIKQSTGESPVHSFIDVNPKAAFAEHINYLFSRGIITGYENNQYFKPGDQVRRGQAVAMIGRSLNWNSTQTDTDYSDVTSDYFASGYIVRATDRLILSGFSDGTFRPNTPITRGQMAKIIGNAYNLDSEFEEVFPDVHKDTTGSEAISLLVELGVVGGFSDGTFGPGKPLTRTQFAAIMARLLNEDLRL